MTSSLADDPSIRAETAWWPAFRDGELRWRVVLYPRHWFDDSPSRAASRSITRYFPKRTDAEAWLRTYASRDLTRALGAAAKRRPRPKDAAEWQRLHVDARERLDEALLESFGADAFGRAVERLAALNASHLVCRWWNADEGDRVVHWVRTVSRPLLVLSERTANVYALQLGFYTAADRWRWMTTDLAAHDWRRWFAECAADWAALLTKPEGYRGPTAYQRFAPSLPAEIGVGVR